MDTNLKERIKVEFLSLLKKKNNGYIISLEALYNWLGNKESYKEYKTEQRVRDYFNEVLRKNFRESKIENDIKKDFIMRKKNKTNFPWFSVIGFQAFCMFSSEEISKDVRSYFIDLEEEYMDALEQPEEKRKEMSEKLKLKIKLLEDDDNNPYKLKFNKEHEVCESLREENIDLIIKNIKAKITRPYLENKEYFIDDGNPEYKELKFLRKKHMKEVWVYIVNPDLINKTITKNIKNDKNTEGENTPMFSDFEEYEASKPSSSKAKPKSKSTKKTVVDSACNDEAFYENNYNEYTFKDYNPESDSPYLYYYISGMKSRVEKPKDTHYKVESIFVQDTAHFNAIKAELDNDKINTQNKYNYKTSKKGVYMFNYKELIRIRDSHLQYELFDNLVKEANDLL